MEKVLSAEQRFEEVSRLLYALKGMCYAASVGSDHNGSNEGRAVGEFSGGVEIVCEALEERLERLWTAMKAEKGDAKNRSESEVSHAKGPEVSYAKNRSESEVSHAKGPEVSCEMLAAA